MSVNNRQTKTAQTERASGVSQTTDFESVFEDHWSRVYGVVFRIVGDHDEAEDLALETFLRLHQRPPRDGTNLSGWLYRVATNLSLNALRARKRRVSYELEAGETALQNNLPVNPSTSAEKAEERRRVRQVLSKMRKRPASILILRHSGLSYAEIAAAVGVAASSVGTLLARAERDFEKRYQEVYQGDG